MSWPETPRVIESVLPLETIVSAFSLGGRKRGKRHGTEISAADQDPSRGDFECEQERGEYVHRDAGRACDFGEEWCADHGGDSRDWDFLYYRVEGHVLFFAGVGCSGLALFEILSVLRAWDAEALGGLPGLSPCAGAAASGGLDAVRLWEDLSGGDASVLCFLWVTASE